MRLDHTPRNQVGYDCRSLAHDILGRGHQAHFWILSALGREPLGDDRFFRQFDELLAFESREIHELRITWLCGQQAGSNKNNDGDSPEHSFPASVRTASRAARPTLMR